MKLVVQDSCFERTLLIDGKDAESLDPRVLRDIFNSLLDSFTDANKNFLIDAISDFIECSDDSEFEDLGDCEQCKSYSSIWTRII
jgi:hypothetical protein